MNKQADTQQISDAVIADHALAVQQMLVDAADNGNLYAARLYRELYVEKTMLNIAVPEGVMAACYFIISALNDDKITFQRANALLEAMETSSKLGRTVLEQRIKELNRKLDPARLRGIRAFTGA